MTAEEKKERKNKQGRQYYAYHRGLKTARPYKAKEYLDDGGKVEYINNVYVYTKRIKIADKEEFEKDLKYRLRQNGVGVFRVYIEIGEIQFYTKERDKIDIFQKCFKETLDTFEN